MVLEKNITIKMILLKGGKVFLDNDFVETNVLIEKNKISKIDNNLDSADEIINCSGKYVLPGLIDIHVHFRDFGQEYKEDWVSGSKAALLSGITTVLDMPNNLEPITTIKKLKEKDIIVKEKSLINFGLYIAVNDKNIDEINNSELKYVKLYYGETTGEINPGEVEKIFKELNKDVLIVAHAEENEIINLNKQNYSKDKIKYHSLIRDNKAEYTAVNYLMELAEKYGNRLHITHVSTKESMLLIKQAKSKGLNVTCDTCPHYLFLDDSLYEKIRNKAKVNPSLKSKQDREALWQFLINGDFDCLCSDHAPHTLQEKSNEYDNTPSGFPGVETTTPLMLTAVNENKIKLEQFVKLMSIKPAKLFGIKNKGEIKVGNIANLTIIDLDKEDVIKGSKLISKAKWSPFEGFKTKGKAIITIINGKLN